MFNVISLEVSHTKLVEAVIPPSFVKAIDWIDTVWPKQLKIPRMTEADALHYPEVCALVDVQLYVDWWCLASTQTIEIDLVLLEPRCNSIASWVCRAHSLIFTLILEVLQVQ